MTADTKNPYKCEEQSAIFVTAKNYSAAATHRELYTVFGPNVMWMELLGVGLDFPRIAERTTYP